MPVTMPYRRNCILSFLVNVKRDSVRKRRPAQKKVERLLAFVQNSLVFRCVIHSDVSFMAVFDSF